MKVLGVKLIFKRCDVQLVVLDVASTERSLQMFLLNVVVFVASIIDVL